MKKIATLLLLLICIAFSCERDDLCDEDTPTTPKMVVEFRDLILSNNTKNVTKLRVEDADDATRVLTDYNSVTEDQMLLPLITNIEELETGITKYRVYKDYENEDGTITGNDDVIYIEYSTREIYVSRACGYKTIFENVEIIIEDDGDNWMEFAVPENDNQSVINEDKIHFTIRH
ncbi:MAG: hypothetical protein QNK89_03775 [Lacinutrix sp.]|uniref:hypothetical protein n=1 Tax=Lacinutrix sp. TaxID=1937692 RepID=UPI0030986FA1